MLRLGILIVLITTLGCSSTGEFKSNAFDRFAIAANSWKGANILEMLSAWGSPNRRFRAPEGKEDGIAWWEYRKIESDHEIRYHCSTVVKFNQNLTITSVEIRHSRDCDRLFDGLFESMTRGLKTQLTSNLEVRFWPKADVHLAAIRKCESFLYIPQSIPGIRHLCEH